MKHLKPELKALFAKESYDKDILTITSGTPDQQAAKFLGYLQNPLTMRFLVLCEMVRNDKFNFSECTKWIKDADRGLISMDDYVKKWNGSLFKVEPHATFTNQVVADFFKELDELYQNIPSVIETDSNHLVWQHFTKILQYMLQQSDYVNQQISTCNPKANLMEKMSWMDELMREIDIIRDIL